MGRVFFLSLVRPDRRFFFNVLFGYYHYYRFNFLFVYYIVCAPPDIPYTLIYYIRITAHIIQYITNIYYDI